MRKIILQEWQSVDGYVADANGTVHFIESTTLNKYSDLELLEWLDTIDAIILGANTYRLFVDFWPTATTEQEVIADKLNSIPKIVFSKSLKTAPWGSWPDAQIIAEDPVPTLRKLKNTEGQDMVVWGSISLVQPLIKANLIDEYHIRVVPIALGAGRPLFESTGPIHFELYETKAYSSGLMLLKYKQV